MKGEEKARRKKAAWRLRCAQSLLAQAAQLTDDMQAWNYVHAAWGSAGIALDRIEVVGKLANNRPRAPAPAHACAGVPVDREGVTESPD